MVDGDLGGQGHPLSRAKAGPFAEVARAGASDPDDGRREIRQPEEAGQLALDLSRSGSKARSSRPNTAVARGDHRRRRRRRRQGGRARADRPGDARHGAARQPRLRRLQRLHQPDRLRPVRQGVQHAMPTRRCCPSCRATRSDGRHAPRCSAPIRWTAAGPAAGDAGGSRDRADAMSAPPSHDVILRLEDVSKVYSGTVAVKRAEFRGAHGRRQRAGRRERRRQVDADEDHRRRRAADARPHPARRRGGLLRIVGRRGGARHRHGVPGAQPVRQHDGGREHLRHARDHQPASATSTTRSRSDRAGAVPRAAASRHPTRTCWSRICASASSSWSRSPRRCRSTRAS